MSDRVAVIAYPDSSERAAILAAQLHLPLVSADSLLSFSTAALPHSVHALLCFRDGVLELAPVDGRQSGPICVDFCTGANAHRLQGGAELIAKAVRGRSKEQLSVLDATAGLGRDSFVLASRGFVVSMLERSPIVAALLADGLERARHCGDPRLEEVVSHMTLMPIDARTYLQVLNEPECPDVIYLDPMFPPSEKSALVKKEMRLFQQLFHSGEAVDAAGESRLLTLARQHARLRVVVKRPRKAEPLALVAPDYALEGKSVRFDVYVTRAAAV
jgi:16S rRNA (guanine1516-N2)-methyltransferase